MSISLSTLTNPATSDSVLLEAQSEADFLEPIVLFKNRATGSNAIANDATQTTANDQPLSLPLIDGDGYLYQPDVTGNAPAVAIPSIAANEDFVFEMEVYLVDATSFHLASGANANTRFAVYNGNFYFSPSNHPLNSPLSTGASTLTVERSSSTVTLKQDGVTKATITSGISSHSYDFTYLSFNGQYTTSIGKLNGYIKTATLSIEGTEVFNCDFADTSIEDGASAFDCSTGQTVTINTGSGVDQARIVRRPKAVFNSSEMDLVWDGPTGDYFFVSSLETGVNSGVLSLVNNASYEFAAFGIPRVSHNRDGSQTLLAIFPNTISDSQKASLVTYAKTKSASSDWATVTSLEAYYRQCDNLKSVDVRHFDVSNKNNISYFAFSANKLESLDASSWDTSSCTNVSVFAASCPELTSLNVNGWDTSNVTNFSYFVQICPKLTSLDLTSWDTSSATSFAIFAQNSSQLTNVAVGANCFSQGTCTNFAAAFTNTNLNQQSIDDILVALESAGTSNGTFGRTGGEYPSTTGVAAKNALQARGWSMTFSSEVLPSVLDLAPAAAYSLRALKSSDDPNVVRVRRSSDGALSNFKASEVTDGTLTTWVGAGNDGQVTTWYDQAGSNDATQTLVSNMPKIVDGGTLVTEGGKPALDFDTGNNNSRLATSAAVKPSNLNNFSLFTVQKATGTAGGVYGVRTGGAPDNRLYLPYNSSSINQFSYGDQLNAVSLGSPPTTHQLVSAIAGSTQGNAQAFINGASQGSTALQDIAPSTSSVIFGSGPNNGSMQEVIMFHNDQSANRTAIETNINDHFDIY